MQNIASTATIGTMDTSTMATSIMGLVTLVMLITGGIVDIFHLGRITRFIRSLARSRQEDPKGFDSHDTLALLIILVVIELSALVVMKESASSSSLHLVLVNLFFEILVFYVCYLLLKRKKLSLTAIHLDRKGLNDNAGRLISLYTGIFVIFFAAGMLSFFLCKKLGIEYRPTLTEFILNEKSPLVLSILGFQAVILAPVLEEILFRGIIFNSLKYKNTLGAALVSAFIFALFHKEAASFIPIFVLGLCFALVYERYKNLWYCVLLHAMHNGLMLIMTFTMKLLIKEIA